MNFKKENLAGIEYFLQNLAITNPRFHAERFLRVDIAELVAPQVIGGGSIELDR